MFMKVKYFHIILCILLFVGCTGKNLPEGCEWCRHCQGIGYINPCEQCNRTGTTPCSVCSGTGRWGACDKCKGTKYEVVYDGYTYTQRLCLSCNGSGKGVCKKCGGDGLSTCSMCNGHKYTKKCPDCLGKGYVQIGHYYTLED